MASMVTKNNSETEMAIEKTIRIYDTDGATQYSKTI